MKQDENANEMLVTIGLDGGVSAARKVPQIRRVDRGMKLPMLVQGKEQPFLVVGIGWSSEYQCLNLTIDLEKGISREAQSALARQLAKDEQWFLVGFEHAESAKAA